MLADASSCINAPPESRGNSSPVINLDNLQERRQVHRGLGIQGAHRILQILCGLQEVYPDRGLAKIGRDLLLEFRHHAGQDAFDVGVIAKWRYEAIRPSPGITMPHCGNSGFRRDEVPMRAGDSLGPW